MMSLAASIKVVFSFFARMSLRNRRTRLLLATAFIPFVILVVFHLVAISTGAAKSGAVLFRQMAVPFLFQLYIPLMGLLGGSACVGDEVDQRTLVYLTTRPVGKPAILLGKAAAQSVIALAIVISALALSFILGFGKFVLTPGGLGRLGQYLLAGGLATLAYTALFVLFGTLLKKPVIAGIIYIFGWEYVVQFIPGSTQKLTISHYVKSLLPYKSSGGGFLMFQLEPSSVLHAAVVLTILFVLFLALSARIFKSREYVLSEPRI